MIHALNNILYNANIVDMCNLILYTLRIDRHDQSKTEPYLGEKLIFKHNMHISFKNFILIRMHKKLKINNHYRVLDHKVKLIREHFDWLHLTELHHNVSTSKK